MEAVLAAHEGTSAFVSLDLERRCHCGAWTANHRAHVAAAVLDWVRTELAAEGMREAVAEAVWTEVHDSRPQSTGVATAALEAVAERLAGGERARNGAQEADTAYLTDFQAEIDSQTGQESDEAYTGVIRNREGL